MSRLYEWVRRRTLESWVTFVLVAGSALFVFAHLQPSKLLLNTTAAGGDMGAHVWGPAFLRDELLPRLRLSGWAPDWYDGFPAYQFYMVVPSLLIVVLDVVFLLPYNVAFKLVSVSGLVALPIAAWAMARLARLPFPYPAAFAVVTVPFVFDRSFSIYGGNAASTLAGEFAFSISLALSLLFLGVVLRGLESGRDRVIAAVLLGLTTLCHLIPAVFALIGATIALAINLELPRQASGWVGGNLRRLWWIVSVVFVGSLLTAIWTVPFLLRRAYMTDMGWEKLTNVADALFPGRIGDLLVKGDATTPGDLTWVIALAVIGVGTSIAFRHRVGIWLTIVALILAFAVDQLPQGRLWNARLLPFWYLCLYFLAAIAVVEIINAVAILAGGESLRIQRRVVVGGPIVIGALVAVAVAFPMRTLPFGETNADGTYSWLGFGPSKDRSYIPDWARWNYSGYERKTAYPEYRAVVQTMDQIGAEHGCGRAMWEYDKELNRFGTPMALMLLPYWTGGCIGSMEGLYFEASATTPYHFLNQSELSSAPSRAQRELPYGNLDIDLGVDHLQLLGVRYYMAFSQGAVSQADAEPSLQLVASSGIWRIYQVADSDLVQPLENQPAVVTGVEKGGRGWQDMAVDWYLNRDRWDVMLAADGPASWQRLPLTGRPVEREQRPVHVSNVHVGTDAIRFRVDRPGTPVLVKASYFPNWDVTNAEGPFRVAPNLMVVVPTDNRVTLHFGRTSIDWFAVGLTLLGIVLLVVLHRRGALDIPPPPSPDEPPDDAIDESWLGDRDVLVGARTDPSP